MKMAMKIRILKLILFFMLSIDARAEGYFVSGDLDLNIFPSWADRADNAAFQAGLAFSSTSQSVVSFGPGLNAGQWVNQLWGWEIGYSNFGNVTGYTTAGNSYGNVIGNSYQYATTASHAEALVGSSSGFFGKVGVYNASTHLAITNLTIPPQSNSGFYFGIGARYLSNDSDHFAFRFGIDIYPKVKFTDLSDFSKNTSETITKIYLGEDYIF
jgi:hypothetical protein